MGIPPAPRGVPQIEVTFDLDANGIVNVSAKDRATGKSQAITITASSGLAKEEVERMVGDAQSHAEDDKRKRDEIEAKNRADSLIYTTEKTLAESKEKLQATDVEEAEKALEAARKAVQEGGKDRIETAVAELTKASHKLAESLYRQASGPGAPGGPDAGGGAPGGQGPGGDDVIDAEVVDGKK
jgi:molecular chaperone DnaK